MFIDYYLQSAVNPHISHSVVVHCREQTGQWSWLKSTKWLCNVKLTPISCPVEAVQILLKVI